MPSSSGSGSRIRFDLTDRTVRIQDTEISLEDHQLRQLRELAGGDLDQESGQQAAERVEQRMRRFIRDCGRPVTPPTLEQEFDEAFSVHLQLLNAELG